ncbi:hypothetical protein LZC95_31210 [Pendulispora brunnea]|uniref:Mandelate racemase/muconate lactonizing enzyme C-terminal domain-containing protein n=1 Tax=Pendulispora brunnea TaxID=2905690 RepID=A0ABZ2JX31_9BACT
MTCVITQIEQRRFSFRHGGGNARIQWSEREGIALRVHGPDGAFGVGEATPLPGYSPDSLADCERDLARFAAAVPVVFGEPVIDAIPRVYAELGIASPAARFAIETAVLDLASKRHGIPLWEMLRGERAGAAPVALSAAIGESAVASAQAAVLRGIRTVKMKVGRPHRFEDELEALRGLRALGGELRVRADANGVWTREEAMARVSLLRPFDLEFLEEPCSLDGWKELAASGIALAADESLQSERGVDAALRLAQDGVCRVFVLKATALGGLIRCLRIARLARAQRAEVVVTHMFEGPIAHAASLDLALALQPKLACGLDTAPHAGQWPRATLVRMGDGYALPGTSAGLGIESHWMIPS